MLTPFDVRAKVSEVVAYREHGGQLAIRQAARLEYEIYVEVLQEIARGSIDPKSLAITALIAKEK